MRPLKDPSRCTFLLPRSVIFPGFNEVRDQGLPTRRSSQQKPLDPPALCQIRPELDAMRG